MERDNGLIILFFGTPIWDGIYDLDADLSYALNFHRRNLPNVPIGVVEIAGGGKQFQIGDFWKHNYARLESYNNALRAIDKARFPHQRLPIDRLFDHWPEGEPGLFRVLNCLKAESIYYADELCEMTDKELLNIPNMGKKSIKRLKNLMALQELSFANA